MDIEIPKTLRVEHERLRAELARATQLGGNTGEAARAVGQLLQEHFVKETEFALPPLGALPLLGAGQVTPEMGAIVALTDRLQAELPGMLEEHDAIVGALERQAVSARQEGRPECVHLAEQLMLHAQTEEEVLYPTTLLIGEYLKLRLNG
jgi:hypothetical protein